MNYEEIELAKKSIKLTEKQKKFAHYYLDTKNAYLSYRLAYGLDDKGNSGRTLKGKAVQEYISLLIQEREFGFVSPNELKKFYAKIMRSEDVDLKTKVQASQQLLKIMEMDNKFEKEDTNQVFTINTDMEEELQ